MRVVALLLALGVLAGCGEAATEAPLEAAPEARGGGAADCGVSVRFAGRTYVERGFTEVRATRAGTAVVASCEDTVQNSRGSYFDENSAEVAVWSFPGHDPAEVVGMKVDTTTGDFYRVLVLEDRVEELVAELVRTGVLGADR